jgi:isochorismate synthase
MLLTPVALADVAAQVSGSNEHFRFAVVPVAVDPLDFVTAAAPLFASARYLATPEGFRIGGVGTAWRTEAGGVRRFEQLEAARTGRPFLPGAARMLLGYSFAPDGATAEEWSGFASAEVILPSVAVIEDGGRRALVVAVPPGAEAGGVISLLRDLEPAGPPRVPGYGDHSVHAVPSGAEWCAAVEEAVEAIRAGSLHKVVLARSVVVRTDMTIDPFEVVHHLAERNPHCHVYGWQIGDRAFVGASPELLIAVRGNQIRANPLAGSAPRGDGDEEDRAVGAALLASAKDRAEHALVVDDIATRLSPLTSELTVPAVPSLRRIATVQHLSTEITGTMANGISIFGLLDRLHPTPAVGGTPRAEAMAFIDKVEGMDRGWYSGGVGWLGPDGDGDVAVALRCGLLSARTGRLYAGNGIVADSEPEAELIETRWKFRPMFNLLTAT